ncbi:hypothetical protein TWF694_010569 [Orbilia ellipsospora]|uniref:Uncharacterized protein n=1 Tax=Orbilia ellipsospora TaxID=2528407 RepID=A0AAV9XBF3_9PEZI
MEGHEVALKSEIGLAGHVRPDRSKKLIHTRPTMSQLNEKKEQESNGARGPSGKHYADLDRGGGNPMQVGLVERETEYVPTRQMMRREFDLATRVHGISVALDRVN